MKCYLSDDLASNLDDENQSPRARREPASNKKKQRLLEKRREWRKQYRNVLSPLYEFFLIL